jgi:hypothetical protein
MIFVNLKIIATLIFILAMLGLFFERRHNPPRFAKFNTVHKPVHAHSWTLSLGRKHSTASVYGEHAAKQSGRARNAQAPASVRHRVISAAVLCKPRLDLWVSARSHQTAPCALLDASQAQGVTTTNQTPQPEPTNHLDPSRRSIYNATLPLSNWRQFPKDARRSLAYGGATAYSGVEANQPVCTQLTSVGLEKSQTAQISGFSTQNSSHLGNRDDQYFLTFICLEVAFLSGFILLLTCAFHYDSIQGAVFSLFLLILLAADSAIALALIHKAIAANQLNQT